MARKKAKYGPPSGEPGYTGWGLECDKCGWNSVRNGAAYYDKPRTMPCDYCSGTVRPYKRHRGAWIPENFNSRDDSIPNESYHETAREYGFEDRVPGWW